MTKEFAEQQLAKIKEDFREWDMFPCNHKGSSKANDKIRASFEREIAKLRKFLQGA